MCETCSELEPVSGFEPLTCRLQEGLSWSEKRRPVKPSSPVTCIKAYQGAY
jgi:hypothetical protein